MSLNHVLSTLNQPFLISALGVATHVISERPNHVLSITTQPLSVSIIQTALACSYALSFASVSIPGRIDGQVAKAIAEEEEAEATKKKKESKTNDNNNSAIISATGQNLSPINGRTLVAPAGWAFAIWGPIFLGELLSVSVACFTLSSEHPLLSTFRQIAIPYAASNVFQSLWCAAFREKYTQIWGGMWISTAMLGSTAYSLGRVNSVIASSNNNNKPFMTLGQYLLYFFPMRLHFGWTTAATLVNLNGAISLNPNNSKTTVGVAGIVTSVGAALGGCALAVKRGAPVFSGVIAWALLAVSDGMNRRIEAASASGVPDKKKTTKKMEGKDEFGWEELQRTVSKAGAYACVVTTAVVGYQTSSFL